MRNLLLSALLLLPCAAHAQAAPPPATTQPHPPLPPSNPQVLRIWGDKALAPTLAAWQRDFRKLHPELRFETQLAGTATSMAGIITGVADLSLMGRPVTPNEVIGFEWVHRNKPFAVEILTGPLRGEERSAALAVLVPAAIPVQGITLDQLASILGCPPQIDHPEPTWALAGVTGPWASRPIHAYLYDMTTGTGDTLQRTIQGDRDRWNWSIVQEFKDKPDSPASTQIAAAARRDPDALAIATTAQATAGLRLVPIVRTGNAYVLPTAKTLTDRTYPLAHVLYAYLYRPTGGPVEPKTQAFLDYILSPRGQQVAATLGHFLPLTPANAADQAKKLQ